MTSAEESERERQQLAAMDTEELCALVGQLPWPLVKRHLASSFADPVRKEEGRVDTL